MPDSLSQTLAVNDAYDLVATMTALSLGHADPCVRVDSPKQIRMAFQGPTQPLALTIRFDEELGKIDVDLSGELTEIERVAARLPSLLGLDFAPPKLEGKRRLRETAHKFGGLRLPRTTHLFPKLVQIMLQQLVSYEDACHGWKSLVRRYGVAVPGHDDLLAPPSAAALAGLASYEFVECGVLPQHGRRIAGAARFAERLETAWRAADEAALEKTSNLLLRQRGIGPWTLAFLRGSAMGDSNAVVLGDYSLPSQIAFFLEGRHEASDDDMLELLEPFQPHRFYVTLLIIKSGVKPPRRGPRSRYLRDRMNPKPRR